MQELFQKILKEIIYSPSRTFLGCSTKEWVLHS